MGTIGVVNKLIITRTMKFWLIPWLIMIDMNILNNSVL